MERPRTHAVLPLILLLSLTAVVRADDASTGNVLAQVPRDALGIVVIRNLAETDAKVGKTLGAIGSRLSGPMALLKSIAGLDAGLDQRRDLLVVLLPPQSNSRQFHLAVWLPVSDYDALVRSLDGDPGRQMAAVTLAGEDLLMLQQGNWAVVMDIDQRDRLEQLRRDQPSPPPQIDEWSEWIGTNDAAVVVLPTGMRFLWAWAAKEGLLNITPTVAPAPHDNDPFAPSTRPITPAFGWPAIRHAIRTALSTMPELARWAAEAEGLACGLRLDDDGNALVGLRVAISPDALAAEKSNHPSAPTSTVPRLEVEDSFVLAGSGHVSPVWIKPLVAPYVRQQASGLTGQFGHQLPPEDLSQLCQTVESAAADVSAFALLTRPGGDGDGVYTNNFLVLRVDSAEKFLERAGKLVEDWNAMVGKIDGLKPLAFDSRTIKVNERRGQEHAIDMMAAAGGPPLPETKASMEKLFGPGGKFRLQFLPIDETTVLLAAANELQVAALLNATKLDTPNAISANGLQQTKELFAGTSDWQLFFSPSGYMKWLRRQLDAVLGAVLGGPIVQPFPESPPIGVAGGADERVVWTEVAVPAKTLRAFAKFTRR